MYSNVKKQLNQLLLIGLISSSGSIYFLYLLLTSEYTWSLYSLPLKILASIAAFILVNNLAPGGSIAYNFVPKKSSKKEVTLGNYIAKYKSTVFTALPAILYISIDILLGINRYASNSDITLDGIFLYSVIYFIILTAISEGFKYISAWVNLKRNWNNEFGK